MTQFDEKGKFFTKVVSKMPVPVVLHTSLHRIEGNLYVSPEERVKDELNKAEDFLALTDAVVYNLQGKELYHCEFITVNRQAVEWLIPREDMFEQPNLGGEA